MRPAGEVRGLGPRRELLRGERLFGTASRVRPPVLARFMQVETTGVVLEAQAVAQPHLCRHSLGITKLIGRVR